MSSEDDAFNRLFSFINANELLNLLSAHPPSGKSYFTDLIRIPTPFEKSTGATRAHIDLIFCSDVILYLCELKGSSRESFEDIEKLRKLESHYTMAQLKKLISSRLSRQSLKLEMTKEIVLAVGCTEINSDIDSSILYVLAENLENIKLYGKITPQIMNDFNLLKT